MIMPCPQSVGAEARLPPAALRRVAEQVRTRATPGTERRAILDLTPIAPLKFRVRWDTGPDGDSGTAPLVLRMHVFDGNGDTRAVFDAFLPDRRGERRVDIRHDRTTVFAELGRLAPDGQLHPMTRSPVCATIPAGESPHEDLRLRAVGGRPDLRPMPESAAQAALVLRILPFMFAPLEESKPAESAASGAGVALAAGAGWPLALRRGAGSDR
jgi:hypothetical protein